MKSDILKLLSQSPSSRPSQLAGLSRVNKAGISRQAPNISLEVCISLGNSRNESRASQGTPLSERSEMLGEDNVTLRECLNTPWSWLAGSEVYFSAEVD